MATRGDDDAWYEGEEPWGRALVVELQRLERRAAARPVLTLVCAIAMTGLVVMKIVRKPPSHIAHVVIAVSEGSLASGRDPIPVTEMQQYVTSALLPDAKLTKLITDMDLFPLRKKLGMPFALDELRDMTEVTVFRNYFLDENYDPYVRRTARIEIAATHSDPHIAYAIARRTAEIIVATSDEVEDAGARTLIQSAADVTGRARAEAAALDRAIGEKELALRQAEQAGKNAVAAGLRAELATLDIAERQSQRKLVQLDSDTLLDRSEADAMSAGLDLKLEIVSERQPLPDVGHGVRTVLITLVVFVLMLPVAMVGIGAFDGRIHDADDVTRLGFVSLGHLPGFAGDRIGSLRARGVRRRRAAQY